MAEALDVDAPDEDAASDDDRDVPAAVLCARCGRADCAGCAKEPTLHDGRTPWEARDLSFFRRLLRTARLATTDGEAFFGGLEDGSVSDALSFALACEGLAIGSLAIAWIPVVYAFVPGFFVALLSDAERRKLVLFGMAAAVPVLSVLMVVLHVLWASGLELGLRVTGAKARIAHCLRYALYSCGWDLVTSPFGFAAAWMSGGFRGATGELRAAVRIPRFATVAYIGKARMVPEHAARRAIFIGAMLTGSVVIVGAAALGVALVMVMM